MWIVKNYFIFYFFILCIIDCLNAYTTRKDENITKNMEGRRINNSTMKHEPTPKKSSFFRLTATKLIVLMLSVILSGIFIYYFFMFYPILCKKERNYDVVEHSRDTTPSPNAEKI